MQGFARVCLAVVTGFVLSWAGQACAQATPAGLEQAKANVISLIEAGSFAEAGRAEGAKIRD